MDLTGHVDELRRQLLVAAEPGGEPARELANVLVTALDAATRLVLLEALTSAADEITRELAPGSVEVRLRGLDPEFVVLPAPGLVDEGRPDAIMTSPIATATATPLPADLDEGGTARITLRLPEQLKARIEAAATRDGASVNSWLAKVISDAVSTAPPAPPGPRTAAGGQRVTGWAR